MLSPPRTPEECPPVDVAARAPSAPRRRFPLELRDACAGMISRAVSVRPPDVVFVKGLVEASEGLACVFAERGGELVLAADASRAAELDRFVDDLVLDIGARVARPPAGSAAP